NIMMFNEMLLVGINIVKDILDVSKVLSTVTSMKEITDFLINNVCRINKPNTKLFDFGIFLEALQSGVLESKDFPQKLFYCFWWGLQNLRFAHKLDSSVSY
ncbi:cyclic nucleotide-gated ion channel 1, partial [Quercus suber]